MDTQTLETQKGRLMFYKSSYLVLITLVTMVACNNKPKDLSAISTYDKNEDLIAVIEIPAGTNKKIEYNKETLTFEIDKIKGVDRVINYLPYIGNYGFIPSTLSDKNKGGDGDPLDIIVLAEALPTGTVIPVIPIGVLKIIDEAEEDDKIIAVPKDQSLQIIKAENFADWSQNYTSTKTMLLTWYRNYDSSGSNQIKGIRSEVEANNIIEKWSLK